MSRRWRQSGNCELAASLCKVQLPPESRSDRQALLRRCLCQRSCRARAVSPSHCTDPSRSASVRRYSKKGGSRLKDHCQGHLRGGGTSKVERWWCFKFPRIYVFQNHYILPRNIFPSGVFFLMYLNVKLDSTAPADE